MSDQYFSERPTSASAPESFRLEIGDVSLDLLTDAGVFSRGHLDKGTRVLLATAPHPEPGGHLVDLGCGYGPIALTLAARLGAAGSGTTVWAVDVNDRALELTRANAAAAGLGNVRACRPEEVPDAVRFAGLWSNPPIRSGKAALHDLLLTWLPRVDGPSYLVVGKNLGSDSLARWLVEQGHPTTRLSSRAGFRVLEVR